MSVQKLVAEADKLLEKGKFPEAVAKLKAAIASEPLNQIVVTKLAGVLAENNEPLEAAKVYGGLGKRLSDAGKSQVAIAIFKQALELAPDDIALRLRYAQECEAAGKLGDAFLQSQVVLNYYLRRKRYFDASNILPVMVRAQPKDDKVKITWVEVLLFCQAEQKLIHLLVALCGPPGLLSPEFPQGGDPATLTPALYEAMKRLVPYFPRDPKVAYTLAWAGYRRGNMRDFYHFLRECLRREPDFCLGLVLFARVLAEEKKLNESLFVYRYFKERMVADKSSDMLSLNRLMESFVEKNGWIKFIEDSGEVLDTGGFFQAVTGEKRLAEEAAAKEEKLAEVEREKTRTSSTELPPEIELGGEMAAADMEILNVTGMSIADVKSKKPSGHKDESARAQVELIKATIEATVAGIGGGPASAAQTVVQPVVLPVMQATGTNSVSGVSAEALAEAKSAAVKAVQDELSAQSARAEGLKPAARSADDSVGTLSGFHGDSVEFTSLIRPGPELRSDSSVAEAEPEATKVAPPEDSTRLAEPAAEATRVAETAAEATRVAEPGGEPTMLQPMMDSSGGEAEPDEEPVASEAGDATPAAPGKKLFNPLEHSAEPSKDTLFHETMGGDKTQIFSPMDVLDAAKIMQNRDIGDVETKEIQIDLEIKPAPAAPPSPAVAEEDTLAKRWRAVPVEGEKTIEFSPVEAVNAGSSSRRPMEAMVKAAPPKPPLPPLESGDVKVITPAGAEARQQSAEAAPSAESVPPAKEDTGANRSEVARTARIELDPAMVEAGPSREVAVPAAVPPIEPPAELSVSSLELSPAAPGPIVAAPAESPAFMPIPQVVEPTAIPGEEVPVDLGDDLLEGPTRIFTQPTGLDKTEHLIKEIKQDLKKKVSHRIGVDMLLKKAERYTAKRNYYLARKALRHAQAMGADEETVKARLREIRKLELPDGLYSTFSSDQSEAKVDTTAVLERLEQEFDLSGGEEASELGNLVEQRIEAIFRDSDPRTILDFGVGLHEMGLFRQAEALFIRLVEEFPDHAFDAYYLAAISKLSRRDFAGAASILKRLSADAGKSELEKIQIYYALGETFEKMRQRERSRQFFKKVAELDANYRNIRHKLEE